MSEQKEFTIKNYFDYLKEGKLMGAKCSKCGTQFIPPRSICNKCYSHELEWMEFSGKGSLDTFSLVHVGARYFVNQGYGMRKPYCFGVVKLKEGPKVSAHIVGPDKEWEANPDNFKIGMALKMKILEVPVEGKDEPNKDLGFELA